VTTRMMPPLLLLPLPLPPPQSVPPVGKIRREHQRRPAPSRRRPSGPTAPATGISLASSSSLELTISGWMRLVVVVVAAAAFVGSSSERNRISNFASLGRNSVVVDHRASERASKAMELPWQGEFFEFVTRRHPMCLLSRALSCSATGIPPLPFNLSLPVEPGHW
jgi:hypothetical protein